jgi:hypothetical protein
MDNKKSKQNIPKKLVNGLLVFAMLCVAFIIGMQAEAKSKNVSYFPIEKSNVRVFPYIGKNQVDLAPSETVIFQIESYEENDRITNRYMLNYWLDPQKPAQVGFVFIFNKPLDLSRFSHIRLKCLLDEPSIWIRVASNQKDMSAVEISKGSYGLTENAGKQEISIPFSVFVDADWKNVLAFNFIVDSNTTFKVASKKFTVEKIEFIK